MSHLRFSPHRTAPETPATPGSATGLVDAGAHDALLLLRSAFTLAPVLFGLDKVTGLLTDWEQYLAPWVNGLVPGTAHQAMLAVGVVEVFAGILVAVRPDIGGYVVAGWLLGIVVNLVSVGGYLDVALRDVGLLLAALALARLATSARRSAGATAAVAP
ncbi:MAG: hypothetical protein WB441_17620 [Nocardioidaceae bacterium]